MTVKIGICSTAHLHHAAYAPILASMDGVEFIGLTDEDEQRGRDAAANLNCDHREPEALLQTADGVVVCSTNADHAAWVDRAAAHGTHVLCEKPLATTTDAANAILETVTDAGIHLGVAMPLRFSEPIRSIRDALEADELGELRAISGTNRGEMPGSWFTDADAAGGGAIVDHTPHIVDVVHDLTGETVTEVYAESGTRFHDIDVEDVNVLSMELTDGTQFLLDGSWSRPDEWPTWGGATLEVLGRDGVVSADCFGQSLTYAGNTGDTDVEQIYWGRDPNEGLLVDFVDSIRADQPPTVTGREALQVVAVIEAAYESVETGQPISVDSITQ